MASPISPGPPRRASVESYVARVHNVELLGALHGQWLQVASQHAALALVCSMPHPTAKREEGYDVRRLYRLVGQDETTGEVLVNCYVTATTTLWLAADGGVSVLADGHGGHWGIRGAAEGQLQTLQVALDTARGTAELEKEIVKLSLDDTKGLGLGQHGSEVDGRYYGYYASLGSQQLMLEDHVRTDTYRRAIQAHRSAIEGKVVVDVGAGSGILSIFAAQAGARRVYAIEASTMAANARTLVQAAGYADVITVIHDKVESSSIDIVPGSVDVIISEPAGFFLLNEQMFTSFLLARDRWLKPGGLTLPSKCRLYASPINHPLAWKEQRARADWWQGGQRHGVDVGCLYEAALQHHMSTPLLDVVDKGQLLAEQACRHDLDMATLDVASLSRVAMDLDWLLDAVGPAGSMLHGLVGWFDLLFGAGPEQVVLGTGPGQAVTHWYQTVLLLPRPVQVQQGQRLDGSLAFEANSQRSYDLQLALTLHGDQQPTTMHHLLRLHDTVCRYLWAKP